MNTYRIEFPGGHSTHLTAEHYLSEGGVVKFYRKSVPFVAFDLSRIVAVSLVHLSGTEPRQATLSARVAQSTEPR